MNSFAINFFHKNKHCKLKSRLQILYMIKLWMKFTSCTCKCYLHKRICYLIIEVPSTFSKTKMLKSVIFLLRLFTLQVMVSWKIIDQLNLIWMIQLNREKRSSYCMWTFLLHEAEKIRSHYFVSCYWNSH